MSIIATGTRADVDGRDSVVFTRDFAAPIDDVWAAITEPERLVRWIGTWSGDPTTGSVQFRMTAEGDDVAEQEYVIEVCEPSLRLVVVAGDWRLTLALAERGGTTTLTFAQTMTDPALREMVGDVGPGWDYYLDRLVAAQAGADVAAVDWDGYYPSGREHYRALFA